MSHAVTLNVPENFMLPLQRLAHAAQKPIEEVVLTALRASLPPLEGLPSDMMENLTALETLNEAALRKVMFETVPASTARALHHLLARQSDEGLNEKEQAQLAALQHQADLVMLRKARAAVLLRFRGYSIPTTAELHQAMGKLV